MQQIQESETNVMKKDVIMELESLFSRSPLVYTTRLDEMRILKTDLSKYSFLDIIESIICESKPRYANPTGYTIDGKIYNLKREYDEHSINYEQSNGVPSINHNFQMNPSFILSFKRLKSKINELKSRSNSYNDETKSENGKNINACSLNKLNSLLAMCKPLKIILEDINKIAPKIDEKKMEVLIISSDSEDDIITMTEDKIIHRPFAIRNVNSTAKGIKDSVGNHVIKNINDFQNVLRKEDLKNSVIVIYNLYLKKLDAYQIGGCYNITEYKSREYTEINKFPMKKCNVIINIIACCWRKRKCFVSILQNYEQYNEIARFINTAHPCKKRCTCCCYYLEHSTKTLDEVNKGTHIAVKDPKLNNSKAGSMDTSKLITMALKYKKHTKWQGYPEYKLKDRKKPIYRSCKRLMQINNTKGEVEFYEFGHDNIVYSKIVNNGIIKPWLFKTLNQCNTRLKFTFTDPADREIKIKTYRQTLKIISFNTECFLRMPITINTEVFKKPNYNIPRKQTKPYKIEHTRSFMGVSSKKTEVIAVIPEMRKDKLAIRHETVPTAPIKATQSRQTKDQPTQSAIMEADASQTINFLIKNILHRFRNVLLTINPDGKVAAALNAPLSSLTYSELNILSQILNHAQSQVDKLGLTPGMCLNPDAPKVINSTARNNLNSSTDTTNSTVCQMSTISTDTTNSTVCQMSTISTDVTSSENIDRDVTKSLKEQKKNAIEKSKLLSNFSTLIANRKHEYEKSFRSYLGDILEATPKITNVFSLNTVNCASSDVPESPLEESIVTNEIDNDTSISTDTVHNSKLLTELCMNEIKEEITILDNEIEPTLLKERKRKTHLKCKTEPPKIRVKTTAEIHVEKPVITPFVSHDLQSVECDTMPTMPLILADKPNSNDYIKNCRLRNLLSATPKKMQPLSIPQEVSQETTPLIKVDVNNTFIENNDVQ